MARRNTCRMFYVLVVLGTPGSAQKSTVVYFFPTLLNWVNFRQGLSSYLRQQLHKLWVAGLKNQQSYKAQRLRDT